jgi:hypothetical protein
MELRDFMSFLDGNAQGKIEPPSKDCALNQIACVYWFNYKDRKAECFHTLKVASQLSVRTPSSDINLTGICGSQFGIHNFRARILEYHNA